MGEKDVGCEFALAELAECLMCGSLLLQKETGPTGRKRFRAAGKGV